MSNKNNITYNNYTDSWESRLAVCSHLNLFILDSFLCNILLYSVFYFDQITLMEGDKYAQ